MTYNEYCILAKVYDAIVKAPEEVRAWFESVGGKDRDYIRQNDCLSALTGVGITTCATAIKYWRGMNDEKGVEVIIPKRAGRGKKTRDENVSGSVLDILKKTNEEGVLNSAVVVRNRLKEDYGVEVSKRTVNRIMKELGCYWGRGTRQHILHDSSANIAYRHKYLQRRFANLDKNVELGWVPKYPEVFLDESYCHLDHSASNRWVMPGSVVTQPGRKPLLVIFAAFVVWFDRRTRQLKSQFVKESVYVWPSIGKSHTKPGTSTRTQHDSQLWNDVPPEIRQANIAAPTNDYHGNFTSDLFDNLFTRVCKNLQSMGLEKCRIHMDGASYHFHKSAVRPAKDAKMPELLEWSKSEDVLSWMRRYHYPSLPDKPKRAQLDGL
ncbi:hypothetical protein BGZ91_009101, partial [Linnemannia elongata]